MAFTMTVNSITRPFDGAGRIRLANVSFTGATSNPSTVSASSFGLNAITYCPPFVLTSGMVTGTTIGQANGPSPTPTMLGLITPSATGVSPITFMPMHSGFQGTGNGTVTQATNKSTGATNSNWQGEVIMNGAALAGGANVTFTLTNTKLVTAGFMALWHADVGTANAYAFECVVSAGSATVNVTNTTGGSLSEAINLHFVASAQAMTADILIVGN